MLPVGFEPTIPAAGERAQTHVLDCAATGNVSESCLIVDMPDNIQFTTSVGMTDNIQFTTVLDMPDNIQFTTILGMPDNIHFRTILDMPDNIQFITIVDMPDNIQFRTIVDMPDNIQFTTIFLSFFVPAAGFRLYPRFSLLAAVCRFTYL
jgi:hypothetical protein